MSHRFTFPVPTDHQPGGWHAAYMEVYDRLFSPFRSHSQMALLEIGTDGGGGLRSYKDYFHEDSLIVGIDISPPPESLRDTEIRHHQIDAYTHDAIDWMAGKWGHFEVIIDDGPHTIGSQEFFAKHYPKLLTADGIAIIEDIAEHGHIAHLARFVPPEFFCYGIDLTMHDNGRYDNRLLVIHRK